VTPTARVVQERKFGSGWISGTISAALGLMAFGAVLCLRFPQYLTTPQLREALPMGLIRAVIHVSLVAAFVLGVLSLVLRRTKKLGATGVGFSVLGAVLGGSEVAVEGTVAPSYFLGLDWFLLDLFMLAILFVPMERLFARRPQAIFRPSWVTDLIHFLVSHILVQVMMLFTLTPAAVLFKLVMDSPVQRAVAAQPGWLQFLEILLIADLAGYWIHRMFHAVPFLWRFHAIHHSSQMMDWLASSRLHLVDIVLTRMLAFLPLYALGFSHAPVYAYLVFVSFHAVFIHANVRFDFGRLTSVVGTPRFHHWHHSTQKKALDKNFAIHLPWIDRLFGTQFLPEGEWPDEYGIPGDPVPEGYMEQFVSPFLPERQFRSD
jgi:sterol desaturase/sphingolipid hydroxylase (fatty acid hydroxylase superfamily)